MLNKVNFIFGDLHTPRPHGPGVCEVHQVHGKKILPANQSGQKADGLFTTKKNQILLIKTADCLPVIIGDPGGKILFLLHAGWKGMVQNIISETTQVLEEMNIKADNLEAHIGPHIGPKSFEVQEDVGSQFAPKYRVTGPSLKINLGLLAFDQLQEIGIQRENIFASSIDTFSNTQWNSYRRNKTDHRNLTLAWIG